MDPQHAPLHERRLTRRRPPRSGVRAVCRVGATGLGPDLALAAYDLSEDGIRLVLKVPLVAGQEVEVTLSSPGTGKPYKRLADVVWSLPRDAGGHWVGAKFRHRFGYTELQALT